MNTLAPLSLLQWDHSELYVLHWFLESFPQDIWFNNTCHIGVAFHHPAYSS